MKQSGEVFSEYWDGMETRSIWRWRFILLHCISIIDWPFFTTCLIFIYHHYKSLGYRYNIFFFASKFSQLKNIIVFHRFNEMKFKYDNQVAPPVKCFGLFVSRGCVVFKIKIVLLWINIDIKRMLLLYFSILLCFAFAHPLLQKFSSPTSLSRRSM